MQKETGVNSTQFITSPQHGGKYYVLNAGHSKFLRNNPPFLGVCGQLGQSAQNSESYRWTLNAFDMELDRVNSQSQSTTPCSYALCHEKEHHVLASYATGEMRVQANLLPNSNEYEKDNASGNVNVGWQFVPCPWLSGAYYIYNTRTQMVLDTHGAEVTCWNNNGVPLEGIIYGNTSQLAGNIRWYLVDSDAFDRAHAPNQQLSNGSGVPKEQLRILHVSDTHNNHWHIEKKYPFPEADILLHTGDFSNNGSREEFADFNNWLGTLRSRFAHIVVILGNHDQWSIHTNNVLKFYEMQEILSNATFLIHNEVNVMGLRIFGSSWQPAQADGAPDKQEATALFKDLPHGVDILMTHCPAFDILDKLGPMHGGWGSSKVLRKEIESKKPKVHVFGHLHEQRGAWYKENGVYRGGVEYHAWNEKGCPSVAPPKSYPCQIISCNAMNNHNGWDHLGNCICGPARLFLAQYDKETSSWNFHAAK